MGNNQSISNTVSQVVNKSVSDVLIQNSSSCAQNNSSVQTLDISNINVGPACQLDITNINQKSVQTPNFSCSASQNSESALSAQLASVLQQNAKAELSGIPGAINNQAISNAVSKTVNDVTNNINMSNTASCVQSNLQNQGLVIDRINESCQFPSFCGSLTSTSPQILQNACLPRVVNIGNINQSLTQAAVANCLTNNKTISEAATKISTEVKQEATAVNTGFFNLNSSSLLISAAVCCLSCLLMLFMLMGGGGGGQTILLK
jgi:hypothetical protein